MVYDFHKSGENMFVDRDLWNSITSGLKQVPIVAVIGPRQSGKSTLIKKMFPDYTYVDMQDAQAYEFAKSDPKGFFESYKGGHGLIIDEAQYAPMLFPQLKVEVDQNPRPGFYILSGSQNFLLHEKISESLAGRVYFYTLLPFSIKELERADLLMPKAEEQIFKGFYPRVYQPNMNAQDYYDNYISTYVERDIRTIRNIDNILMFKKFMQLCALRVGAMLNYADLAANCGITVVTARSWLALLETSFIIFLLPSYHDNLGKRVTKAPKLYFYDVGLAAALMGIEQEILVKQRQVYGALFENMVIVDIIKNCSAQALRYSLTFYRDTNQREIDVIIETAGKTIPVEIKASETMTSAFFDTLIWFCKAIGDGHEPLVVYGGQEAQKRSQGRVVSWKNLATIVVKK
jgi:uncharacterized protein